MKMFKRCFALCLWLLMMVCAHGQQQIKFVRLTSVSQLNSSKRFIIVSEQYGKLFGMSIRHSDCERGGELLGYDHGGYVMVDSSLLDGETVDCNEINYFSPRKVCLLRALDIENVSSTCVEITISMAKKNPVFTLMSDAAMLFGTKNEYSAGYYGVSYAPTPTRWLVSTDIYNDRFEGDILPRPYKGLFIKTANKQAYPYISGFPCLQDFGSYQNTEVDEPKWEEQAHFNTNTFKSQNANIADYYTMGTYIYVEDTDVCDHKVQIVSGTEPTCMQNGVKESYHCMYCGQDFIDFQCTQPLTSPDDLVIPVVSHNMCYNEGWEATCTQTGHEPYYNCTYCYRIFADEEGQHEIENMDSEGVIQPLPHHMVEYLPGWEPQCNELGGVGLYFCDLCDRFYLDEDGHGQYVWNLDDRPSIPALGHNYEEGSSTCSHCGEARNVYYPAYTYDNIANDGFCIFITQYDGKYYAAGRLTTIGSVGGSGGRGRGEGSGFYAYEAVEVHPLADGGIVADGNIHEIMRIRMDADQYRDAFGWREGYRDIPPYGLYLRFQQGVAAYDRTTDFQWNAMPKYEGNVEVFEKGYYGSEYTDERTSGCPRYTSLYQFTAGETSSLMRFKELNGKLYFTCRSNHMAGVDEGNGIIHGNEYPYFTYTLVKENLPSTINENFDPDLDGDGKVDRSEIDIIVANFTEMMDGSGIDEEALKRLDSNGDGQFTISDIVNIINMLKDNK